MDAEAETCAVCLEPLCTLGKGRQTLSCHHKFHERCVVRLRQYGLSARCPLCRADCEELTPLHELLTNAAVCHVRSDFSKAAQLFEEALSLEPENATAGYFLGVLYFDGEGVHQDLDKAKGLLEMSHKQGNVGATRALGIMYFEGMGVKRSVAKAKEFFEIGVAKGCAKSMSILASVYVQLQDAAKAIPLLEEAHAQGEPMATSMLGSIQLEQGNFAEAKSLFEMAHAQGELSATMALGGLHQSQGNFAEAKRLFEIAQAQDATFSAHFLGVMCYQGQGVMKNFALAKELFEETHQKGYGRSTFYLAIMYFEGHGVPKNPAKATELFELAHSQEGGIPEGNEYILGLAKALASQPSPSHVGSSSVHRPLCDTCGGRGLHRCTVCFRAYYCSQKCQKEAWPMHKQVCKQSAAMLGESPASPDALARWSEHPKKSSSASTRPDDFEIALDESRNEVDRWAAEENSHTSRALLLSRSEAIPEVYLFEFSRDPASFHNALMTCPELESCRQALEHSGFRVELPCKAKVFVKPELYEVVRDAIGELQLKPHHVLVAKEYEELVKRAVGCWGKEGCKGKEKVRCKHEEDVPLGMSRLRQFAVPSGADIEVVSRTFIHLAGPSPNSLRSAPAGGSVTASTSDARGLRNPTSV